MKDFSMDVVRVLISKIGFQSKFIFTLLCVVYMFLLLVRISSNVLRSFPFKRKAAGSLFWKFSKKITRSERCQKLVSFCAPCSSPCVLVNISWNSIELFLSVKRCFCIRMLLLMDGRCNLKEMMIIVDNFVFDGVSTSRNISAPNRNLFVVLLLARFLIGNRR